MPRIAIEINATASELADLISALSVDRKLEITVNPQKTVARSSLKPQQQKEQKKVSKRRPEPVMKRGRTWTAKETAWLTEYAKNNAVNKKIVPLFSAEFGYARSYSSVANKAYECRQRKT